jgi:hypothetical protein
LSQRGRNDLQEEAASGKKRPSRKNGLREETAFEKKRPSRRNGLREGTTFEKKALASPKNSYNALPTY